MSVASCLIPNLSDSNPSDSKPILLQTYLIKPIWLWTYLIICKPLWFWTNLILNLSDTGPVNIKPEARDDQCPLKWLPIHPSALSSEIGDQTGKPSLLNNILPLPEIILFNYLKYIIASSLTCFKIIFFKALWQLRLNSGSNESANDEIKHLTLT